ncbi:MAG TPA: hypothetical protein VJZ74_06305 [Pseudolabrys sp.]|nr:hypothetical protein [Pseudolabrys sp.]
MDTVIQFLKDHVTTPVFDVLNPMLGHWEALSANPRVLAAVALLLGAILIIVGARLLLFATLLMLIAPIAAPMLGGAASSQYLTTDNLYLLGLFFGALGMLEATLKLIFGREPGAIAFMTVIGVIIGMVFRLRLPGRR